MDRSTVRAAAVVVANLAVLGSTFLPWVAVGSNSRNSYGLFRAAQTLGIDGVTPYRVAWFLVPVVIGLALMLVVLGYRRSGLALGSMASVVVGGLAVIVLARVPDIRFGAIAAVVAVLVSFLVNGWAGRRGRA